MTYRVVVWGPGNLGKVAIRAISRRPDMELVGVGVHSPEKAGQDAGLLAGIGPLGLTTTADIDALIALKPDCVAYTGASEIRDPEVISKMARFLGAGINLATTSSYGLMHPPSQRADHRHALEAATAKGRSSAFSAGLEPGFGGDHLSLVLTMMSETVDSIRIQEIFRYDGYPGVHTIFKVMGLGMPLDYQPLMADRDLQIATWGGSLYKIAERLGVELDDIRCTWDRVVTPRTIEAVAGTIEAGTVGAIRFETIGVVNGRDAIVIEHINRMADDLVPEWPSAVRNGTYRVVIEGSPNMVCNLEMGRLETFSPEGRVATAMLMVNAIPYLCEAPPGLLTSVDLPFNTPRHVFG
jgi:hypothetical protein